MSVPVGKRKECDFRVLRDAEVLAGYTMQKVRNERLFPKKWRWVISQRLLNETLDLCGCIRKANSAKLDPNDPISCQYRHQQQIEAQGHISTLYELLDLAFANLSELRNEECFEYWTDLLYNTEKGFQAWIRSDEKVLSAHKG